MLIITLHFDGRPSRESLEYFDRMFCEWRAGGFERNLNLDKNTSICITDTETKTSYYHSFNGATASVGLSIDDLDEHIRETLLKKAIRPLQTEYHV